MWKSHSLIRTAEFIACCIVLQCALFGQTVSPEDRARADQALEMARAGNTEGSLKLYETVLKSIPNDVPVLRDYAVVLGWAGKYPEAIKAIKKLRDLQNEQPIWAVREFGRTYLFGDATIDALRAYDELVERGDNSEQTLIRRALALRWLGRSAEAKTQYESILQSYPGSATAYAGLAITQAEENKYTEALRTLNILPLTLEQNPEILEARIRILNLMGRHLEAQQQIDALPIDRLATREMLEERVNAERWGGMPVHAQADARKLLSTYPSSATRNIWNGLQSEYGHSINAGFRYSKDSDGLVDRVAGSDAAFHINPAHVIRLGYQYRWLEQNEIVRPLVRLDLGWTGTLNRRLIAYATASSVDYREPGVSRKFVGDGSVTVPVNDAVRLNGGGGSIVMDAFNAIGNHVSGRFGFGEFSMRPGMKTRFNVRYSLYSFSDDVHRDRLDGEIMRVLQIKPRARLTVGWRTNLMWHDQETSDFYSPAQFQSYLAVGQAEGRITRTLGYSGEIAAGWQFESNSPSLHPFQAMGKLNWQTSRRLNAVLEAGKSTSSLDRPSSGARAYSRWVVSAGLEFRIPLSD